MKTLAFLLFAFISLSSLFALPTVKEVMPNNGYLSYSPTPRIKIVFSEPVYVEMPGAVSISPSYAFDVYSETMSDGLTESISIELKNVPYPGKFTITLDHNKIKNNYYQYLDGQKIGSPSDFTVSFTFQDPYTMFKAGEEGWFPVEQDLLGSITIYSVEGRELVKIYSNRWDGTANGVMLKSGGYLFIVRDKTGKTIMKGRMTLIK